MSGGWIDILAEATLTDTANVVTSLTRIAVVKVYVPEWYGIGDVFRDALNYPGIPKTGDAAGVGQELEDIRVEQRVAKFAGWDGENRIAKVRIEIQYGHQIRTSDMPIRGGGSITQIPTTKDKDGNPIEVSYGSDVQRVELNVNEPQSSFTREIVLEMQEHPEKDYEWMKDPEAVRRYWINTVNDDTWRDDAAKTLLISRVEYELVNMLTKAYKFTFEIERREDGWKYTAAYKDSNGNTPSDVVEGTGIKDYWWHFERDFSRLFT